MPDHYPNKNWSKVPVSNRTLRFASRVASKSRQIGSYALFVSVGGNALIDDGQVSIPTGMQSVRKSLMNALIGRAVADGQLDLATTVTELGIDDVGGLSRQEGCATVRDCLMGRSGVYHRAAYEPLGLDSRRPERGSHSPGEYWFYNNWDFNVLATIFHRSTGLKVFDAFADWFAGPLQMEDFDPTGCSYFWEDVSDHPAYLFSMSARDLARFGLLYLRDGVWNDQRLLPSAWVTESLKPHSEATDGYEHFTTSFGWLWWNVRRDLLRGYKGFGALGGSGHGVFLLPELDAVIVHRNFEESATPSWEAILPLVSDTIGVCEQVARN